MMTLLLCGEVGDVCACLLQVHDAELYQLKMKVRRRGYSKQQQQ